MRLKIENLFESENLKKEIPNTSGVYIVRVPSNMKVLFMEQPDGRANELPNIYEKIIDHWEGLKKNNADTSILYFGKAKNLRRRIMQYVNYGYAYKKYRNHEGGRAIWYISNNKELEFEFYETDDYENEESRLIHEYESRYGYKPLANAVNGKGGGVK